MNIYVTGLGSTRTFNFPANFFKAYMIGIFGEYRINGTGSCNLTARARHLAKDIISLGGIEKVTFNDHGQLTVWAYSRNLWHKTDNLEAHIRELIEQHYGPQAARTFYLPFGITLTIPK